MDKLEKLEKMENKALYEAIDNAYVTKDYKKALKYINIYLTRENYGVDPELARTYINCLINTEKEEIALKYIDKIDDVFPGHFSTKEIIELYIKCGDFATAESYLKELDFLPKEYYSIANKYLKMGKYEKAIKYYEKGMFNFCSVAELREGRSYIERVERYQEDFNCFLPLYYRQFKKKGLTLRVGDVVDCAIHNKQYQELDEKYNKRSYMIWKIENDDIYLFPLSIMAPNKLVIEHEDSIEKVVYRYDEEKVKSIKEDTILIEGKEPETLVESDSKKIKSPDKVVKEFPKDEEAEIENGELVKNIEIGNYVLYNNKKLLVLKKHDNGYITSDHSFENKSNIVITHFLPENAKVEVLGTANKEKVEKELVKINNYRRIKKPNRIK